MKYIFIAGVIILGIFLIVLHFIPLGIEPLTELYFENHTSLPKYIFLNKPYNFSFTIHNLEYQDVEYNYNVSAFDTNNTFLSEIDSGKVYLSNNETKTIHEDFLKKEHFNKMKVNVNIKKHLIGEPEFKKKLWWPDPNYPMQIDIHFWVEEIVGTTIKIIPD